MIRIVQQGSGSTRPLVLVYHVQSVRDPAFVSSLPGNAAIVIDYDPNQSYYETVPALATTVGSLSWQLGASLSPVVLAGFSAGGFATQHILDLGGDPDALVLADATYGSNLSGWRAYAQRALVGERKLVASYSSNVFMEPGSPSPWRNLQTITGLELPLGAGPGVSPRPTGVPVITTPTVIRSGGVFVHAYPGTDHTAQGAVVLPTILLPEALGASGASPWPARVLVAATAAAALLAAGYGAAYAWDHR